MPLEPINFFIVEDELAAQEALIEALGLIEHVQVVGCADNVRDAFDGILASAPHALFLDIKLRGGDAFELLEHFRRNNVECPPAIVMTGHDDFELAQQAINGFREKILKILKKPFWGDFDRHFLECRQALEAYYSHLGLSKDPNALYIKDESVTYRIKYSDIHFVEVGGSGTIFLGTSPRLENCKKVPQTLSRFMTSAPDYFIRIHRAIAIQLPMVSHINHNEHMIYLDGYSRGFPIGRTYYPQLMKNLGTQL